MRHAPHEPREGRGHGQIAHRRPRRLCPQGGLLRAPFPFLLLVGRELGVWEEEGRGAVFFL